MDFKPISTTIGTAAQKAADIAEQIRNARPEELIARGVDRFGWSPTASCGRCGDTGIRPLAQECCDCPAGRSKREEHQRSLQLAAWERSWADTNVPKRFRDYRLSTSPVPEDRIDAVLAWIASNPFTTGSNLILLGAIGSGKTGIAVGVLRDFHEVDLEPLWFVSTSSLIDAMKPESGDEGMLLRCQRAAVLVIDDLGTTRGTPWEQDRMFALFNTRYEQQLPTIVTTNIKFANLAKSIGERVVSRLTEDHVAIAVPGSDLRQSKARHLQAVP